MKYSVYLLGGAAAVISLSHAPAIAQVAEGAQVVGADAATNNIEEILVTAQRRSQSLTQVPLSIQAFSGGQLNDKGITTLTAIGLTTPGYVAASSVGYTQIFIRGIGNAVRIGADPSVATFVDDVPRIYGSMSDNLVDVERIEVLKGAQGGLYGRNATGGVVNIITSKPQTESVEGKFRASYGEKNSLRISGFLNLPLSDKVALTVSAQRESHDGYTKNLAKKNPYTAEMFPAGWSSRSYTPQQTADYFNKTIGTHALNTQDFWATTAKLLLRPSDNFQLTLAADYYNKDDTGGMGLSVITPEFTQNGIKNLFTGLGITTNFPAGLVKGPGKFEAANGSPELISSVREYGVSGTAVWNLPGVDLTSITAFRDQTTTYKGNSSGANINDVLAIVEYPSKNYVYQELRAVSTFDGPVRLLGGATYLRSSVTKPEGTGGSRAYMLTPDFQISNTAVDQRVVNYTVYGEVGYDFTDLLTLTASARYLHETNEAQFTLPVVSAQRATAKQLIPAATLSYKLDQGTVYARWARGFKTGGINVIVAPYYFPRPEDGSIFKPEVVDTFEIGYRQQLFDRSVQVTAAVFYNAFKDLQESARGTPAYPALNTAIINADSARTWGIEGGVSWRTTPEVTLGMNAGYLNAKYKNFDFTGSTVIANIMRDGMQMPKSPELQVSFTGNLDRPISDDLRLVGNILTSYTSKTLWAYSPLQGVLSDIVTPGYWLTNARIGVKTEDDKYSVALAADNLFNQGYYVNASSIAFGNSLVWGNPRIIRAEFTMNF